MTATYRLPANELDSNVLDAIRAAFVNQEIELIVHNVDETDYLMSTEVNKNHLMQALERTQDHKNRVFVELQDIA